MTNCTRKIAVLGLGYVGLPLANALSKKYKVIGFDVNESRVEELTNGVDRTNELSKKDLADSKLFFTSNSTYLSEADFYIVTVPTPIDSAKTPDLSMLRSVSNLLGKFLKPGDIVTYESTVYPGLTEEICLPILEKVSGLRSPDDFAVAYSPERINPGDKEHTITTIKKIVSANTEAALEIVADVYGSIITAGVYKVSSIRVAEAAKVIENTQRDINIALMNELSIIFDHMNIDTSEVLAAAATKWNFLPFKPGLVGGHCIGVDPYYLTYKAEQMNYHPQMILAGRRINDEMAKSVVNRLVKRLINAGHAIKGSKVAVLGVTFKADCPDIRNSKVFDLIRELTSYGIQVIAHDPMADPKEVYAAENIELCEWRDVKDYVAMIIAAGHEQYASLNSQSLSTQMRSGAQVLDIMACLDPGAFSESNLTYWRL